MQGFGLFVRSAVSLLAIAKPVELRIRTGKPLNGGNPDNVAGYMEPRFRAGKVIGYVIVLNLRVIEESGYSLEDTLAHEICHAAQFEHGIFRTKWFHDEKFQGLCKILEKEMPKLGFPLGKLYSAETDTD